MTEATMKWEHGETWYRVIGDLKSGKTPVMVLHGGPGAAHNYVIAIAQQIAASGRPAVLYDQIGCGNSTHLKEKPSDFWTPELFIDELFGWFLLYPPPFTVPALERQSIFGFP